jgi:hypothetical protein
MKIIYLENEKRHIFESETGHMSTFLKERVTKEQAEALFLAQLANGGITAPAVDETPEPDTTPAPPVEPPVEPAPEDVTPTDTANA